MKAWMSSNFGKFATELLPLIDVRIEFLFNILRTNKQIETKFLYTHYHRQDLLWYCKSLFFCKLATELQPLIDVRIWYLLNILRTN